MGEVKLPNPHELYRKILQLDEALLSMDNYGGVGPLLEQRYNLMFCLVILDRYVTIGDTDIRTFLDSEPCAQLINKEIDGIPKPKEISAETVGDLGFVRGGILERFAPKLRQDPRDYRDL